VNELLWDFKSAIMASSVVCFNGFATQIIAFLGDSGDTWATNEVAKARKNTGTVRTIILVYYGSVYSFLLFICKMFDKSSDDRCERGKKKKRERERKKESAAAPGSVTKHARKSIHRKRFRLYGPSIANEIKGKIPIWP